jgi:hypothetical protein
VSVFLEIKGMVGSADGILKIAKYRVDPAETFHAGTFSFFTNNFSSVEITITVDLNDLK